jgi:hypothetical protein
MLAEANSQFSAAKNPAPAGRNLELRGQEAVILGDDFLQNAAFRGCEQVRQHKPTPSMPKSGNRSSPVA